MINNRYVSFYYENDFDIQPVQLDLSRTALLIIDMQHVFISRPSVIVEEDPSRLAKWEAFYNEIEHVVLPNNAKILQAFRDAHLDVVFAKIQGYTSHGRERSLTHKASGFNSLLLPPGEKDANIVDALSPQIDEIVLSKTTDGAVTGTALRLLLHNMGIDTVVVTGVFTDQCVSGTVRALADESYKVWLIEDACMAATKELHENELMSLNNIYCHVINTQELLDCF